VSVASTPCDAPAPLTAEQIAAVPGVLGRIAAERARDYAAAAVPSVVTRRDPRPAARFQSALRGPEVALIAEVKRASPSQGAIADLDPLTAAQSYAAGGAAAISVLTEPRHFGGDRAHLRAVSAALTQPTLRKDFVVHPQQIVEAADDGAAAVLLIVAVVAAALPDYLAYARACGLAALVEVHDEAELALAMAAGADLIGVNNRDLTTLAIDIATAPRLISAGRAQGHEALWVAESGYSQPEQVAALRGCADAVLIGSSLAGSGDLAAATAAIVAAARGAA